MLKQLTVIVCISTGGTVFGQTLPDIPDRKGRNQLDILKHHVSGAFYFRKMTSRWLNTSYKPRQAHSSAGRRTRWIHLNKWSSDSTLVSHMRCHVRTLPFIWRQTLEVITTFTVQDSLTIRRESRSFAHYKKEDRETHRQHLITRHVSGDSAWTVEVRDDGQFDSTLVVRDEHGFLIYQRVTSGLDTNVWVSTTTIQYDTLTNAMAFEILDEGPFQNSRAFTRKCACLDQWRPYRCEVVASDGELLVSEIKYGKNGQERKRITRRRGRLYNKHNYRYWPYRTNG